MRGSDWRGALLLPGAVGSHLTGSLAVAGIRSGRQEPAAAGSAFGGGDGFDLLDAVSASDPVRVDALERVGIAGHDGSVSGLKYFATGDE